MVKDVFCLDECVVNRWGIVLLLVLVSYGGIAQRETREVIDAKHIETIRIDTDEVFSIRITTTNSPFLSVKTHSEGEYYDDIILDTSINGNEFRLTTRYPEILIGGYDKLSAHKVFSLEIEMEIPAGMDVIVNSNLASVIAKGDYKSIYANLKQGYCHLLSFSGDAVINTYTGDILVETNSGLIEASSRNGKVDIPEFLPGRNPLRLISIDGDIMVRKN